MVELDVCWCEPKLNLALSRCKLIGSNYNLLDLSFKEFPRTQDSNKVVCDFDKIALDRSLYPHHDLPLSPSNSLMLNS